MIPTLLIVSNEGCVGSFLPHSCIVAAMGLSCCPAGPVVWKREHRIFSTLDSDMFECIRAVAGSTPASVKVIFPTPLGTSRSTSHFSYHHHHNTTCTALQLSFRVTHTTLDVCSPHPWNLVLTPETRKRG